MITNNRVTALLVGTAGEINTRSGVRGQCVFVEVHVDGSLGSVTGSRCVKVRTLRSAAESDEITPAFHQNTNITLQTGVVQNGVVFDQLGRKRVADRNSLSRSDANGVTFCHLEVTTKSWMNSRTSRWIQPMLTTVVGVVVQRLSFNPVVPQKLLHALCVHLGNASNRK